MPAKTPMPIRLANNSQRLPNGCLIWTGATYKSGHGRMTMREPGRRWFVRPHRVAYELAYGPIPEGKQVHHECEDPRCIEPGHLVALTPKEHRRHHEKKCPNCGHTLWGNGG